MAHYICQVVFQGATELPKDRFVNTLHFTDGVLDPSSAGMLSAVNRIARFFTGSGGGAVLGTFLSSFIDRQVTVNVYDAGEPKPRTPYPFHFFLPTAAATVNLPEEVALCLSFYSARNVPRQRGRIYLGPFNLTALEQTTPTQSSRPHDALVNSIRGNAAIMANVEDGVIDISDVVTDGLFIAGLFLPEVHQSTPSFLEENIAFPPLQNVNWVQYSAVGQDGTQPTKKHPEIPKVLRPSTSLVTAGWVDNRWDSQRRRQIASSARSPWVPAAAD